MEKEKSIWRDREKNTAQSGTDYEIAVHDWLIRPISRPLFLLFEFRTVPKKGKKKEKIVIQREIETNEISTRSTQSGKRAYAESHEFVQFVHLKG
jgi:hypothetical protein